MGVSDGMKCMAICQWHVKHGIPGGRKVWGGGGASPVTIAIRWRIA